jgi:hypothetical protein
MQGRKRCGMTADNEGHGLISTVNRKAHPTSHAAVVARSMWRSNGKAVVKCQLFVSQMKLNNPKLLTHFLSELHTRLQCTTLRKKKHENSVWYTFYRSLEN